GALARLLPCAVAISPWLSPLSSNDPLTPRGTRPLLPAPRRGLTTRCSTPRSHVAEARRQVRAGVRRYVPRAGTPVARARSLGGRGWGRNRAVAQRAGALRCGGS